MMDHTLLKTVVEGTHQANEALSVLRSFVSSIVPGGLLAHVGVGVRALQDVSDWQCRCLMVNMTLVTQKGGPPACVG